MPRLIDATPIETDLDAKVRRNAGRNISIVGLADALARIYAAPTVDAVQVVRCRDCQSWREPWLEGQELGRCMRGKTALTGPCHFCAYGERNKTWPG